METRLYLGNKNGGQQSKQERLQRILLQRAQAQRMAQQMRLAQLKIDEVEKRVISVSDMDAILVEIAGAISSRLRSQPSRLMDRLKPHIKPESHDELYQLLMDESASLLTELKTMERGGGLPIDVSPETDEELDGLIAESPEPDDAA